MPVRIRYDSSGSGSGTPSGVVDDQWCTCEANGNLLSAGEGPRQVDLSGGLLFGDTTLFSINETGAIVVPRPGLYLATGWTEVAIDLSEGSAVDVSLGVQAVDTALPNYRAFTLGRGVPTADAAILGFDIPFSGVVALPDSQDTGPLKFSLAKSGGWSTTDILAIVTLTILRLPGTGGYAEAG